MFPLGCATGCFQAAVEAETDVDCLLSTLPAPDDWRRRFVMPYVAVAVLAMADVLDQLAGKTVGVAGKNEPESFDLLRRANASFRSASSLRDIRKNLNREVRNRVSAHRSQQSAESVGRAFHALSDDAFPSLLTAARRLLWTMQTARVWYWGRSHHSGGVVLTRCRTRSASTLANVPTGFVVPEMSNHAEPQIVLEADIAEEVEIVGQAAGHDVANEFWKMKSASLYCCGRRYKDR